MNGRIFREVKPDNDFAEEIEIKNATDMMLDYFQSPLRKMILVSLSCGNKNIFELSSAIKAMSSSSANASIKRAIEYLHYVGLVDEEVKIYKLTEKGKKLAEIFKIYQAVFKE